MACSFPYPRDVHEITDLLQSIFVIVKFLVQSVTFLDSLSQVTAL